MRTVLLLMMLVACSTSIAMAAEKWSAWGKWQAFSDPSASSDAKRAAAERHEAVKPRPLRIVWITAPAWCGPCRSAHSLFTAPQPGGKPSAMQWMSTGGWDIGSQPSDHVQIVDYDEHPEWCGKILNGESLPWCGVVKFDDAGEPVGIVRRFVGAGPFSSKTVLVDLNSGKIGTPQPGR